MKKFLIWTILFCFSWSQVSLAYSPMPNCHNQMPASVTESKAVVADIARLGQSEMNHGEFCPHSSVKLTPAVEQLVEKSADDECCGQLDHSCHCQSMNTFSAISMWLEFILLSDVISTKSVTADHFSSSIPNSEKRPPKYFS